MHKKQLQIILSSKQFRMYCRVCFYGILENQEHICINYNIQQWVPPSTTLLKIAHPSLMGALMD